MLTDTALKNLKSNGSLYKVSDRDGMFVTVAASGAVVLDEGVAHHYYFLAQRTHAGRVPVIIPRETKQVMATVSSPGEERVTVGGAQVSLFHLVVRPTGGPEAHVWVDALGRVIKVEIPARAYRAERRELPR